MIIILNTIQDGAVHLKALEGGVLVDEQSMATPDAIEAVARFLERHQSADIEGYGAVVGAGRFSATRSAVCVANALALAGGVKAVEIPHDLWDNNQKIEEQFSAHTGAFACASYSGAPSITKSHGTRKKGGTH